MKDGIMGEKWPVSLACDSEFHVNCRVLLQAANLRHGTDGFTSPLKARCGFFCPKNLTASAGNEPVILGTRGQHANHWTTKTAGHLSAHARTYHIIIMVLDFQRGCTGNLVNNVMSELKERRFLSLAETVK
jgi:hypothetical protein